MPMGPYSDFESCIKDQKSKGKSEETARKICGFIKKKTEGGEDISLENIEQLSNTIIWAENLFGER